MSFGSNGVDWVRSLGKIATRLHLANLLAVGTNSACFASIFVQQENGPKQHKQEFWVKWSGLGAFVAKKCDATLFSELVR